VPDAADGSLDPGNKPFSVKIRFLTHYGENLVQKGQATTSGGQFKMQIDKGKMTCIVHTSAGTASAGSGKLGLSDGAWHTAKCVRSASSVKLYVDGKLTDYSTHATGTLDNAYPWSIGGKSHCNGQPVECDYFHGRIDYVRFTKG